MLGTALQILYLVTVPLLVLAAARWWRVIEVVSPVVLCYAAGLLIANLPFVTVDRELSMGISEGCVGLAIPLLLFASDFVAWLKTAKKAVLSFGLCVAAVLLASAAAAHLFADHHPEAWKLAGMMVGVYTGGTPNMSAIGLSLGVAHETFILLNAADVVMGGAYLLFILSVAQRLLSRFLPAAEPVAAAEDGPAPPSFAELPRRQRALNVASAVGIAVGILGVGLGLSFAITGEATVVVVVLTVTSLAIAASFVPWIRGRIGSQQAGELLLLIFCVAIGSVANIAELLSSSSFVFEFVGFVMGVSVLIHYLAAFALRIDADTVIATSAAGIFGPAFAGPVASALKNPAMLITGLTTGLVGYAVGNYLGLGLAYLLSP